MSDTRLLEQLSNVLPKAPHGPLRVALSGGMDSCVLLHAMSRLDAARARDLRAIHINHNLHQDSAHWASHCEAFARDLNLPIDVIAVEVDRVAELGLEGAARAARYAALQSAMESGGVLATAHHRRDQAETVLLRLLHASGVEGCAGMRRLRRLDESWLWRPLLDLDHAELVAYAERHDLSWIDDPSNADARHARTVLRAHVLPSLRARWPDADRRIANAAMRLRDESDALDTIADQALAMAQGVDPATLDIDALRRWPPALQRIAIGHWLDALSLPRPPPAVWNRLAVELFDARDDSMPLIAWRGAELRRYRTTLNAMAPLSDVSSDWHCDWNGRGDCMLPSGFGVLRFEPAVAFDPPLRVQPRRGGERLQQAGAHRELRTLLQDLGIPPWQRARLPLVCAADGEVLAAADIALAPAFAQRLSQLRTHLHWRPSG
jgi:tRNA(Ile)-lysidine synthase